MFDQPSSTQQRRELGWVGEFQQLSGDLDS